MVYELPPQLPALYMRESGVDTGVGNLANGYRDVSQLRETSPSLLGSHT